MDDVRIDRLDELEKHLETLQETPEEPFDAKLLDDVELQLTPSNIPALIPRLLPLLTHILSTTPHDPSAAVSLTLKLLGPLSFTHILRLASESSLTLALASPSPAANILALTILQKATSSPSDTAILSIMRGLVAQLVTTWLSSPSVDVGEKATRALGELLEVDAPHRPSGELRVEMNGGPLTLKAAPPGQGLLWRRLFTDREIYDSVYALCSAGTSDLDERQRSLAQGRLLRLLPRLAVLDLDTISRSQFPDVERQYGRSGSGIGSGVGETRDGLLSFAALRMVDKTDILMHITLLDFFAELMTVLSESPLSSSQLEYLSALMKHVVRDDTTMLKSLDALAESEESSPELVQLLRRLKQS